ncbi:hypothetical protein [Anaeromicrobium sediminis]|uniref:Uncharacterized protein n=1 Tax=Anaeromicrobium sediminis TaxID=1478221 RepID=A0A267MMR1_9FIRM|nr:hypothetical protein [Anaeromicrobium sediminis]PAB60030.1 hypothetical protein CCE28_06550 [Anaeromicrobium sediminis]
MLDRKGILRLLKIKRLQHMQLLRRIEHAMQKLYEKEQNLKRNLYQVEVQEEKFLQEMAKQLDILDEIDAEIEALTSNSIMMLDAIM